MDLLYGKRAVGTKWVFQNKKDERGIVIRNKARLVAQGHTQEEGIDYDEVFALVARIEGIRLFLAYASFKDFVVYQMDVKSAFSIERLKKSQEKYVAEILKKYDFSQVKNASTPMETQKPLLKDEDGEEVDVHIVCMCKIPSDSKVSHLHAMKRIFKYLKGQPKFGLWYLKDSPFDLVAYTDSNYAEASLDRKSPTGGCQFIRCRLISWQCKKQTVVANSTTKTGYVAASSCSGQATIKAKTVNREGQLQALVDGKKILITESTIRRDLQLEDAKGVDCLPNAVIFEQLTLIGKPKRKVTEVLQPSGPISVADDVVNEEMDDNLERAATTATSLDAEVLDLKTTKTTQAMEIESLKRRVKKLERRKRSRTHGLKRLYKVVLSARVESSKDEGLGEEDASKQGRIVDIDANEDIILVSTHDEQMFDVDQDLGVTIAVTTPIISIDEVTLAQAIVELKHKKPKAKAKRIVFYELEESTIIIAVTIPKPKSHDKGKAKMIKEPVKLKKKDQIQLDEEVSLKLQAELQAEFEKEQRLAGERTQQDLKANIALIELWDDVQAKNDLDYQLAKSLLVKERQELNDEEKAKLFMQLLKKRRKFLAAKRAKEMRNKPPTQAQQR
nr:ribonuclease H-like domain, reverse transcriptase, RNA-dependent DNA polymerase [Tanacetum cinerariifolium]